MAYYKRDMLSISTRNLIAEYLADLTLIADSIQEYRIALAELPDFDGISLFRFLDRQEKGYLSVANFQWLITDTSKKLLHYAFSWFDVAKVGEVTRIQFIDFLLTKQNPVLRQRTQLNLQQAKIPNQIIHSLPYQTDTIKSLILQIIQKQIKLIPMRRKIMNQDDYSIQAVMNSLDNQKNGYITVNDLFKFMKNYGIDVKHTHMKELLSSYDFDLNGKISINQLLWIIQGFQNKSSQYRQIIRSSAKQKPKPIRNHNKKIKTQQNQKVTNKTIKDNQKISKTTGKKKSKTSKNKQNIAHKSKQDIKGVSLFENQKIQGQNLQANYYKTYETLKKSFKLMSKQVQEIDRQLIIFDKQLQAKAIRQLESQLQQLQVQRRIEKQQFMRREEERKLLLAIKIQEQQFERRALALRHQQIAAEEQSLYNLNRVRYQQIRQQQQAEYNHKQLFCQQKRSRLRLDSTARSRLQSFEDRRSIYSKSAAKINKYLIHDDPLGIKQHLAETDQYLLRSKQLRERIKVERDAQKKLQQYVATKKLPSRSHTADKLSKYQTDLMHSSIYKHPKMSAIRYEHTAVTRKAI